MQYFACVVCVLSSVRRLNVATSILQLHIRYLYQIDSVDIPEFFITDGMQSDRSFEDIKVIIYVGSDQPTRCHTSRNCNLFQKRHENLKSQRTVFLFIFCLFGDVTWRRR